MSNKFGKYQELMNLAEKAAVLAGDYLYAHSEILKCIIDEKERDIKLKADVESEKIIIDLLHSKTKFPILSEEIGLVGVNLDTSLRWIVDPLDGTFNYLEGLPFCCVSVGLWRNNSPLLGVIYDFVYKIVYKGVVGVGAWRNDIVMRVKKVRPVNQGVLCTGFPISMDFSEHSVKRFVKQVKSFKKIRMFGSAAMSLAYVASGQVDAYYENNIKIWDVAAGLALVEAAGGVISVQSQFPENILNVYAGAILDKACV